MARPTTVEEAREYWAKVAKENGWYSEPFYVQVWFEPDGTLHDAVSSRILKQDIIIQMTQEELEEEEDY